MNPLVEITGVAHGGTCVGRVESGKVVFVRHTAPGETVRVRITEELATRAFADAIEVVEPSPHRTEHVWPAAQRHDIGGAELGHLSIEGQHEFKEAVLTHTLRRIGGADVAEAATEVRRPIRSAYRPGEGSRTRLRTITDDTGRPAMRKFHSNELVAIDDMPLAVPELADLRDMMAPGGTELRHVATSRGDVHVCPAGAEQRITEEVRVGDRTYSYRLTTDRFWQAHRAAPTLLANQVVDALGEVGDPTGINVLELFSGVGLFSAPIADAIGSRGALITVEGDKAAVADAKRNVPRWVEVRAASIDPRSVSALVVERPIDAVVLDPPRSGAGAKVCRILAEAEPTAVVMISCDPAALARDIAVFMRHGYRLEWVEPFDLFEHTHHLETTALLTLN
ncbi:class I SAM-dependent RNA methyltransferase [Bowdeniella nasicola]|nr:TRAM domain-containing protein [Bowdeniella nasicola]